MKEENEVLDKLASIEQLIVNQSLLQKEVLTFAEACQFLKVSASHLYQKTSRKEIIHFVPTGKKIYFLRKDLESHLLSNRQGSVAESETGVANYLIKKPRYGRN